MEISTTVPQLQKIKEQPPTEPLKKNSKDQNSSNPTTDKISQEIKTGNIPAVENQINLTPQNKPSFNRKGNMFAYWGYNRSAYSNSDIHFKGDGYDFTLYDVKAEDSPTPLSSFKTYVNPKTFTVPQYNWRFGYYLNDKYSISIGHDHMKYEMNKQTTTMSGYISPEASSELAGNYQNTPVLVGETGGHSHGGEGDHHDAGHEHGHEHDDLPTGMVGKLEHCDGLNDFSVELGRTENLWVSKSGKSALSLIGTVGLGAVIPDTEATVLGQNDPSHGSQAHLEPGAHPDHDAARKNKGYHLAGYSASVGLGVQLDIRNFFIQGRVKGGYINLPDVVTTHEGGRASQSFSFIEPMVVVGYSFNLNKK